MLLNDAYPSLGHMAHQNMTVGVCLVRVGCVGCMGDMTHPPQTLCENYACAFHDAGGGSQNHIMLGGWNAWLLSAVGGRCMNGAWGAWGVWGAGVRGSACGAWGVWGA